MPTSAVTAKADCGRSPTLSPAISSGLPTTTKLRLSRARTPMASQVPLTSNESPNCRWASPRGTGRSRLRILITCTSYFWPICPWRTLLPM